MIKMRIVRYIVVWKNLSIPNSLSDICDNKFYVTEAGAKRLKGVFIERGFDAKNYTIQRVEFEI